VRIRRVGLGPLMWQFLAVTRGWDAAIKLRLENEAAAGRKTMTLHTTVDREKGTMTTRVVGSP
jgi:hypothetical protein